MKKKFLYIFAALAAVSCSPKAELAISVDGCPDKSLAVLGVTGKSTHLLDSLRTDSQGRASYSLELPKGEVELVYVLKDGYRLAAAFLEPGSKVSIVADTLGNYRVSGNKESEQLCSLEADYRSFIHEMDSAEDLQAVNRIYVDYYRKSLQHALNNKGELSTIPLLYQQLTPGVPVFSQYTDAIVFRQVCDSLKQQYPQLRIVKALEKETKQRENQLAMSIKISTAQEVGFPDIVLPDVNAQPVSLAGIRAKAVLLHFWSVEDAAQKLINTDILIPLYEEYHSKGFEIYSVCVSTDKALWASVLRNQKLPWINVCDGFGTASGAVSLYNVSSLPYSLLIADGSVSTAKISGEKELRRELSKLLK